MGFISWFNQLQIGFIQKKEKKKKTFPKAKLEMSCTENDTESINMKLDVVQAYNVRIYPAPLPQTECDIK